MVVHFLEAGGTGAGVCLVAGETQVTAASIVGATAVPASYRADRHIKIRIHKFKSEGSF